MRTDLFPDTLHALERALDLRSRQHRRIAANVANRDTPGYRAFEVDLEAALADGSNASRELALDRTRAGHLAGTGSIHDPIYGSTFRSAGDALSVPLRPAPSGPVSLRGDGNTVDLDREMARLSENALMYTAAARMLAGEYGRIRDAIEERTA
jgi:flagellar basal-body rod protein FlgB